MDGKGCPFQCLNCNVIGGGYICKSCEGNKELTKTKDCHCPPFYDFESSSYYKGNIILKKLKYLREVI